MGISSKTDDFSVAIKSGSLYDIHNNANEALNPYSVANGSKCMVH